MCGIAGYWSPNHPGSASRDVVERMLDVIEHRGPDGRGEHIDPERGLAMGHARLSIIDLAGGHQPLYTPDRSHILTVNGEFYDYKRIRARLATEGARFSTKSDSEIALELYRRHGMGMLEHLRGEFAFALFDEQLERLILVRDRFGIKPLYYHLSDQGLVYGSEVKSILMHPQVNPRLDRRAALHQMMQVMVPGTTAFEGVRALRPGHVLVAERSGGTVRVEEHRYWDFEFPRADDHDTDPDEQYYITGVRDRLLDAIGTRLEADVPVGCYLSGGIDSCSILGVATPMQQSPVRAFTISFDHDKYDEASIAREMAHATGADQVQMDLSGSDLYGDHFARVLWHTERTFYNTLSVAKWHMSRRVHAEGMKVVITGEGSDELFGGYPFFKIDMFRHAGAGDAEAVGVSNEVFQGAILSEESPSHHAWDELCGFTPAWLQNWLVTLDAVRPLFSDDAQEELRDYDPAHAIASTIDPSMVAGRHPLDIAQYTWSKTMLEGQILTWGGDRVDMANSMESRPAFLDHHLAEFAARIPPTLRIKGNTEKYVLREAMKHVLPRVLYEREKFAFMAPPSTTDEGKQGFVRALTDAWLVRERVEAAGLFDPARVSAFLDGAYANDSHADGARKDIIMNHLLGMQMLDAMRNDPSAVPEPASQVTASGH